MPPIAQEVPRGILKPDHTDYHNLHFMRAMENQLRALVRSVYENIGCETGHHVWLTDAPDRGRWMLTVNHHVEGRPDQPNRTEVEFALEPFEDFFRVVIVDDGDRVAAALHGDRA